MKQISITFLLSILLCFLIAPSFAQKKNIEETMDSYLDKMNLDFLLPIENQIKVKKPRKNEFFKYQMRITDKSRQMEVLIAFYPAEDQLFASLHPHLEFNRLLGNLTPNDDEQEVLVVGWQEDKLKSKNADWGVEAYFRTREVISSFPYAKLISFYKEAEGMIVMLYCFNKPDFVPELLVFQSEQ